MNPHSIPIGVGGFADRTELTGIQCMYAVVLSGSIKRKNPKTKTCAIYILVEQKIRFHFWNIYVTESVFEQDL